jgi:hypothetical protein
MIKLIPGQSYWISEDSEEGARLRAAARIFIGTDTKGVHWFENIGGVPVSWTYWSDIPQLELIPWTIETCPPLLPSWITKTKSARGQFLTTSINPHGITSERYHSTWKGIMANRKYSLDGETWLPCGILAPIRNVYQESLGSEFSRVLYDSKDQLYQT